MIFLLINLEVTAENTKLIIYVKRSMKAPMIMKIVGELMAFRSKIRIMIFTQSLRMKQEKINMLKAYYQSILKNKWDLPKHKRIKKFTYDSTKRKLRKNDMVFILRENQ
jgi:hypothetical protein